MRIEKRRRGAVYGLQIEANRTREDHERGRDFDRSDVDWERTADNVHLVRTDNWNKEITRQIHAAGLKERKNSTVMLDGLYTASAEWFASHTPQEAEQYFRDCLAFHVQEYCGGDSSRVINAVIHLDEKTPHMQVASVPIIEDEKGMHLSAKMICGGRQDFRLHQNHFYEQVAKSRGLDRGEVRDDAELKAHTTKREWQIATQDERLQKAQERAERQEHAIEHNRGVIDAQAEQYTAAKQTIERARDAEPLVRALDAAPDSRQIAQNARKSLFGEDLKISPSDLETLSQRAAMGEGLEQAARDAAERERKSRAEIAKNRADAEKALEDAKKQAAEIVGQAQREAAEARRTAQEWQEQARAVKSARDEYVAIKSRSDAIMAALDKSYTQSVFKEVTISKAYDYADRGILYVQYTDDGSIKRLPKRTDDRGLAFMTEDRPCRYGIITDEPKHEIPDRLMREVRKLTRGQNISRDLRAALDRADGIREIGRSRDRGLSR